MSLILAEYLQSILANYDGLLESTRLRASLRFKRSAPIPDVVIFVVWWACSAVYICEARFQIVRIYNALISLIVKNGELLVILPSSSFP